MGIINAFSKFFGKGVDKSLEVFTKSPKNNSNLIKILADAAKSISKMKMPKK